MRNFAIVFFLFLCSFGSAAADVVVQGTLAPSGQEVIFINTAQRRDRVVVTLLYATGSDSSGSPSNTHQNQHISIVLKKESGKEVVLFDDFNDKVLNRPVSFLVPGEAKLYIRTKHTGASTKYKAKLDF